MHKHVFSCMITIVITVLWMWKADVYEKRRLHEDCVFVCCLHVRFSNVGVTRRMWLCIDEVLGMNIALHTRQTFPSSFLLHSYCHDQSTDLSMTLNKTVTFDKFAEWE